MDKIVSLLRIRLKSIGLVVATSFLASGCGSLSTSSKTQSVNFSVVAGEACGAFPTVTYRAPVVGMDQKLSIMAGDQPTPGYQIIVTSAQQQNTQVDFSYRIEGPPEGSFLPQMMTRPCINIEFSDRGWDSLTVTNRDTDQVWRFNRDIN